MGFAAWAATNDVPPPKQPLGPWLRTHPEVAAELSAARATKYDWDLLVKWLAAEYGLVTDVGTLRRRLADWTHQRDVK